MALLNRISLHRTVYFTHICHFFFRQSTKTWTIPLLLILFLISFETRFTLIYLFQWKVVKRCHLSTSSKSTEAKPYNHSTIQPTIIDGGHWFIRLKLWVTCECIDFGHRHTSNRQFINEFAIVASECICSECFCFCFCFCNIHFGWWDCVGIWILVETWLIWRLFGMTRECNRWLTYQILSKWQIARSIWETWYLFAWAASHEFSYPQKHHKNSSSQTDCVSAATVSFFIAQNDLSLFH